MEAVNDSGKAEAWVAGGITCAEGKADWKLAYLAAVPIKRVTAGLDLCNTPGLGASILAVPLFFPLDEHHDRSHCDMIGPVAAKKRLLLLIFTGGPCLRLKFRKVNIALRNNAGNF